MIAEGILAQQQHLYQGLPVLQHTATSSPSYYPPPPLCNLPPLAISHPPLGACYSMLFDLTYIALVRVAHLLYTWPCIAFPLLATELEERLRVVRQLHAFQEPSKYFKFRGEGAFFSVAFPRLLELQ